VAIGGQEVAVSRGLSGLRTGETRTFALRPEAVGLGDGAADLNRMRGIIDQVSFLGSVPRIRVKFRENAVSLDTFNNPGIAPPSYGQEVDVNFSHDALLLLDGAGEA
jgi:putative spermidine/putrescine transport system ATP-binding protein